VRQEPSTTARVDQAHSVLPYIARVAVEAHKGLD